MIYAVRHLTTYRYAVPVGFARCVLRLTPASNARQTLLSSEVTVDPAPGAISDRVDFFGQHTRTLTIETPHRELRIEANSRVAVKRRPLPDPERSPSRETVAATALATRSLDAVSPVHYLFASRRVPLSEAVTDYCRASFPPGRPTLAGAIEVMNRIRADFTFDWRATEVATPLAQSFAARRGVCQDFAHIMIAGLRGLGVPAAYVSGYLRTFPPPGKAALQGTDASHAWVSVWCGHDLGWIGLDPTNGIAANDSHIELATARDYADISPVDGTIMVSGRRSLEVAVDVTPLAESGGDAHETQPRDAQPSRDERKPDPRRAW